MNDIFRDLIREGKVMVYLDDILIFSKNLKEHREITKRVLQRLRENNLFLKAEKCEFEVLETEYLGVIISENSIRMDPVKLAGIAEWPTPTKKRGTTIVPRLHQFLPKVHQELFEGCKGAYRPYRTRALEVDTGARQSICRAQTANGRGRNPGHSQRDGPLHGRG